MPQPPKYTLDERVAFLNTALEMQRQGLPQRKIAEHLGVNHSSLSAWLRERTLDQLYPPKPFMMPRNRAR